MVIEPALPRPCDICGVASRHTSKLNVRYAWCLSCLIQRGCFSITQPDGAIDVLYSPTDKLRRYHSSTCPHLLMEGSRGTGKSMAMRNDCHMRALAYGGYTYLILRRTIPELKKTHLKFIEAEMQALGGYYHKTDNIAYYPNGSTGVFGHCETEADVMKHLGSQYCLVNFDEITTFPWDTVAKISTCARVPEGSGLIALIRAGTNPIGVSAEDTARYYIHKDITFEEDPEYNPDHWENIHLTLEDNPHLDREQYRRQFSGIPEAYRKAWLDGTWGVEGAYFNILPDNVIKEMPTWTDRDGVTLPANQFPWMYVYRTIDWGFNPDPAVCLWILIMPDGREIIFKEQYWSNTTAKQVAREIVKASENWRVITTFSDPTIWNGLKEMGHCLADEFENSGVPLTKSKNDRIVAGYAIQEHLNTVVELDKQDKTKTQPKLLFYEPGCPTLLRAMRSMRVDPKMPGRIADHKLDHGPITLGYFCMAGVGATQIPHVSKLPAWMVPKSVNRANLKARQPYK